MKLAITGALGHIGSRIIHSVEAGRFKEILLIDNLATLRYCSLFNLPVGTPFRFVEDDIASADLDTLLKGSDVVLHLAAITDATSSFEKAEEVLRVNLGGTERVARACARNRSLLLFPSTTSVYGTQGEEVDEACSEECLKPQSPYAVSKLRAENLLAELGRTDGLRFVTCRLGTIFGTSIGMRFHTAINKFCWQAVVGQPITVWKTAMFQRRPYLDLGDAVRAFNYIITNQLFDNRVYNIVTVNSTVSDIIKVIETHIPNPAISLVETEIMNQLSYTVSSRRFTERGFQFQGDLQQGIRDTIDLLKGIVLHSR